MTARQAEAIGEAVTTLLKNCIEEGLAPTASFVDVRPLDYGADPGFVVIYHGVKQDGWEAERTLTVSGNEA